MVCYPASWRRWIQRLRRRRNGRGRPLGLRRRGCFSARLLRCRAGAVGEAGSSENLGSGLDAVLFAGAVGEAGEFGSAFR
eukprot:7683276-Alexandrium_andersonii.AAC.1